MTPSSPINEAVVESEACRVFTEAGLHVLTASEADAQLLRAHPGACLLERALQDQITHLNPESAAPTPDPNPPSNPRGR